ncbi:MAG: DUF2290 domain-containing protein [Fluviicola sp.]
MNDRKAIMKEIKSLTSSLIDQSISINQNFPLYADNEVNWENYSNMAFILKNESYEKIYNACIEAKDYNIMLLDGGFLQFKYQFKRNKIESHVLGYFPNPNFERFQDNPEFFEELYFGNELFTDIFDDKQVIFPVRFDFSDVHTEIIHPRAHATLGNYKDCRIPISHPVSPKRFTSFILQNFYNTKFVKNNLFEELKSNIRFDECITENEKKIIHLAYE